MFSTQQKREIAEAVQRTLRATAHPELPKGEIRFLLHVDGAEEWSWADIRNNGAVENPAPNPWNEKMAEGKQPAPAPLSVEELARVREALARSNVWFEGENFCPLCEALVPEHHSRCERAAALALLDRALSKEPKP